MLGNRRYQAKTRFMREVNRTFAEEGPPYALMHMVMAYAAHC
jgi:hypothetical protein